MYIRALYKKDNKTISPMDTIGFDQSTHLIVLMLAMSVFISSWTTSGLLKKLCLLVCKISSFLSKFIFWPFATTHRLIMLHTIKYFKRIQDFSLKYFFFKEVMCFLEKKWQWTLNTHSDFFPKCFGLDWNSTLDDFLSNLQYLVLFTCIIYIKCFAKKFKKETLTKLNSLKDT